MEGSSDNPTTPSQTNPPLHDPFDNLHWSITSNQGESPSSSTSTPPRPVAARRRTFLNRLSPAGPQSRNKSNNNIHFNPEAAEFVPAVKMPSKRKASSSAKSGKSTQDGSRSVSYARRARDLPIIKAEDIFASTKFIRHDMAASADLDFMADGAESSEDEIDLIELSPARFVAPAPVRTPLMLQRVTSNAPCGRVMVEAPKREHASRKLSAILVSHQQPTERSGANSHGTDRARYLPLCPMSSVTRQYDDTKWNMLTVLPSEVDRVRRIECTESHGSATWPLNKLPVELFDLITAYLARDDVKSMRMVNKEFEQKVSRSLFHTSVVPFNTELYDMIDEDKKTISRVPRPTNHGKGKMKAISQDRMELFQDADLGGLQWQNAKEDKEGKVYKGHGLRVFQGFGPHIKRFGMSFEIAEKQLSHPPIKKELDHVESYHGVYDWPSQHYARFANLAGLENTADETSRMKAAFSNLDIVQELALSIDSGLGWLDGPDKSVRGRIFERSSAVFGSAHDVLDRSTEAANALWNTIQQSQHRFSPEANSREINFEYRALQSKPAILDGLGGESCSDTRTWLAIDLDKVVPSGFSAGASGFGVLYTAPGLHDSGYLASARLPLTPSELRKEQKEWLLETQWAQQAFLESYMLAVMDNPSNFGKVTTMTIAKLSSRFLPMLGRETFWDALPCLSDVVLHISADWRSVEKDDAGFAETNSQNPSEAVRLFHRDILRDRISLRESIKNLDIGWVGGGEHAEGMFARNGNILPAPITQLEHCTANSSLFGLVFKYVEHLTLSNCWITPPLLEGLVKSHSSKALKKLTLDSVSLTAHPQFPANGPPAGGLQIAQAMAAMQAQVANNHAQAPQQHGQLAFPQQLAQMGPGFLQGLNAQQLALMQQHWNQQLQQMQQLFNAAHGGNHPQHGAAQIVPPPPPPPPALNVANSNLAALATPHWTAGHRDGCWPQLLNVISPGIVFNDYQPAPAPWEDPLPPRPESNLHDIEFKSCGYAKLPNHGGFDQIVLEPDMMHSRGMSPWFRARYATLKPAMMESRDRNLGQIMQYMPQRELDALQFAWGLSEGWEDSAKAEEAEFDGLFPGGTGRFSGIVEKGMTLVGEPAPMGMA